MELSKIYFDPKSPGSFGGVKKLYQVAKEINPKVKFKEVDAWIRDQDTYNLFRRSIKNFPRLPILVDRIDEQWQADIMDMTWLAKSNNNIKYLLNIIDCLTREPREMPKTDLNE